MLRVIQSGEEGFSLIEFMVVVVIIGILAAIAVPNFISHRNRSRITKVIAETSAIRASFGAYASDDVNHYFPSIDQFNNTATLVSFLNNYGGTFSTISPGFTYGQYSVTNSQTNSNFELVIHVDGVPSGFPGKVITVTPRGITKSLGQ